MGLTIKVPVKGLEDKMDVRKIVGETLKDDRKNAYSIMGLMVEKFGVKEADILGRSFRDWKNGYPSLYTKIRMTLEELKREGKVKSTKSGRAIVYWWIGS